MTVMRFTLKRYRMSEGISVVEIEAPSSSEARTVAEAAGYHVLSVVDARKLGRPRMVRGSRFNIDLFSEQMLGLLDAGLGLVEAIELLAVKARNPADTAILGNILRALHEGCPLSTALAGSGSEPSSLYVATIKSSEQTGDVVSALRRYLAYRGQLNAIRSKTVTAAVYPLLLLLVGGVVIGFLLFYVVPRFARVFDDIGTELPWMARILVHWGGMVDNAGALAPAVGMAGIAASIAAFRHPTVIKHVIKQIYRVPAIGERIRLYQLARVTRTLAMLLAGGIPFATALDMAKGVAGSVAIDASLESASGDIRTGASISSVFEIHQLATEVGVRLLQVGERSGEMAVMMNRIAILYDTELARWVDWFTRLFEPLLMMFIGWIVGCIVLLMYMPIFELANAVQ